MFGLFEGLTIALFACLAGSHVYEVNERKKEITHTRKLIKKEITTLNDNQKTLNDNQRILRAETTAERNAERNFCDRLITVLSKQSRSPRRGSSSGSSCSGSSCDSPITAPFVQPPPPVHMAQTNSPTEQPEKKKLTRSNSWPK